jgi:hypothetical protein
MKYKSELKFYISNILLLYLWCILVNKISYTEELVLSLIYIVLFIIISEKSRNIIKELMINQSLKLIFCYEQLIYLKIKMITKSLKLLKILKKKIYIKNINNIINLKIKNKKKNYVENRKKISNIKKIYYIYFFLISKIYNR